MVSLPGPPARGRSSAASWATCAARSTAVVMCSIKFPPRAPSWIGQTTRDSPRSAASLAACRSASLLIDSQRDTVPRDTMGNAASSA